MNQATVTVEKEIRPVHPGEVIADLLEDLDMTTIDFARKLDVSPDTVEAIIQGRLPVTVE
jgi:addiction module HigA family antidote